MINPIKSLFENAATRWGSLLPLLLLAALVAWVFLGWDGWVQSWIGSLFKATSGALLGFWLSRTFAKLDLSVLKRENDSEEPMVRALVVGLAGVAQALMVVGMACAVAFGF
jgi:hypothetical protein